MRLKATPAPRRLLTFGECLKEILKKKGMSASALARLMGMRSRNSLFRILDDGSTAATQRVFYEKLEKSDCLKLSQTEKQQLLRALEVSRVGVEGVKNHHAMLKLLTDEEAALEGERIRLDVQQAKTVTELDGQLDFYARQRSVKMIITGCCDRRIYFAISKHLLVKAQDAVEIIHCLYTGGNDIIRGVSAIQPVLYAKNYRCYCVQPGTFNEEREQVYRVNGITVDYQTHSGEHKYQIIMLIDKQRMLLIDDCNEQNVRLFQRMIQEDIPQMRSLKHTVSVSSRIEDHVAYLNEITVMERGREIYGIKRDLPLCHLHPDDVYQAVLDGLGALDVGGAQQEREIVEALYIGHLERYKNHVENVKAAHTILSLPGMRRFVDTGMLSDHFYAMRALNPHERLAVLLRIRHEVRINPCFHLYFFREELCAGLAECFLYDGMGAVLWNSEDHYRMQDGHAEAIITEENFCSRLKAFFKENLLVNWVMDAQQAQQALDALIERAQALI